MKKIMFDDKYGLTKAVLSKSKTMTRRMIPLTEDDKKYLDTAFDWDLREAVILDRYARYKVGDEVAICQSYKELMEKEYLPSKMENEVIRMVEKNSFGCTNKMYVRAELMPHRIRITERWIEKLQDITDAECLQEGIIQGYSLEDFPYFTYPNCKESWGTAREAFASLICKIGKKDTWESNPYVIVYRFESI